MAFLSTSVIPLIFWKRKKIAHNFYLGFVFMFIKLYITNLNIQFRKPKLYNKRNIIFI